MSLPLFLFCLFLAFASAGLGLVFNWLEERNEADVKRMLESYGEAPPSLLPHWDEQ